MFTFILYIFLIYFLHNSQKYIVLRHAPSPSGWVPSENTFASRGMYASLAFFASRSLRRF